ncbi:DUF1697 domain-containing protein [Cyclobacterium marinum]|uniref:DUF1697 domain-containing protein n=1 Tax=Cyclobacterium marinum (strain ATCC 25205 / DSM 745 / LMG 13164 / NCIMB 1802) TaxID=880070 RepID=G0J6M7_CYCMS|nr:DUF1697 domain-containing protein [Cyclobacterium marinum]AEL28542.1 protein of unknown function DUF1697 [Cyclobacterium marinum DSM 745]
MDKKIAILRGINVGGKRKILMVDLKSLFEDLGYKEISTYIQSGNVIFKSAEKADELKIANSIEKAIEEKFGFEVPVIVRTAENLQKTLSNNPFSKGDQEDIAPLHITFLAQEPAEENLIKIKVLDFSPDKFKIEGKDVFIYCEGKYHQSKLTNNFFESKLKVKATTRNLKTVRKLCELSQ